MSHIAEQDNDYKNTFSRSRPN